MKLLLLFAITLSFLAGLTGCGRHRLFCRDRDTSYADPCDPCGP